MVWTERFPFFQAVFVFAVPKILASSDLNNRRHGGQRPLVSAGLPA